MPSIIIADPPGDTTAYDRAYPNMGILSLIAYLRKHFPDLQITYLDAFVPMSEHIARVVDIKPDIYGLSFSYLNQRLALQTLHSIRSQCPDMFIVCGGPGPTGQHDRVLQDSPVDCCVIGEGEETMRELVAEHVYGKKDWRQITGIAYKQDGQIIKTEPRKLIMDLGNLPYPAWDMIDPRKYVGQHYQQSQNQQVIQAGLVISRGCPYRCAFCSNPVWKVSKPEVRTRPPQKIAEEVEYLYSRGVREIKFVSDELNVNIKWAKEVCQSIIALEHKDLYFQTNLRADKLDEEFVILLRKMGCWLIHLGVESANDRVLEGIGKHVTIKQVVNATKLLKKHGIKVFWFMMAFQLWRKDGKIEWESKREVLHSLWFCIKLRLKGQISYMSWSVATPMPDTELWEIARVVNKNFEKEVLDTWEHGNQDYLGFDISSLGISQKERQSMIRLGIFTKGMFALLSGHFDFKKHWYRIPNLLKSFLYGTKLSTMKKQEAKKSSCE
ncbi:MAG: radical SAM protein [Candidatus Omnitrophica bacterium]|nr:radical SAM protein [Candidatus Omnitrophota bacterium]